MPCRSDYLEPNRKEQESQRVSQLLQYLLKAIGRDVPTRVVKAAKDIYGDVKRLDHDTDLLCRLCHTLTEQETNQYIYDGRNPNARKLADWWEAHEAFDRKRRVLEKEEEKGAKLRKQALAKLTDEEIMALGLKRGRL